MPSPVWPAGLLTPLLTPFRGGALDLIALRELVDRQVAAGAAALVVAGGTGEYGMLTGEERIALAEAVADHLAGRLPLIVQTGAPSTPQTIALSRHAESVGALGVLVASPPGISWPERRHFYASVHDAIGLPILVYNTPPSGLLSFAEIQALAASERVTGIKDSSGDVTLAGDLLDWAAQRDFAVYIGFDSLVAFAGAAGATGALIGTGNVVPEALVQTFFRAREGADLGATWPVLRAFLRFMEESPAYFALCKVALQLEGLDVGPVRRPRLMPDEDERRGLTEQLAQVRRAFPGSPCL